MGVEHLGSELASSSSSGALLVIVIGLVAVIVLLIVLVLMLRRNLESVKAKHRAEGGFVAGTLDVPLTTLPSEAAAAAPVAPEAPPQHPEPVLAPAVSWEMQQDRDAAVDPENVPIPAFTGPKVVPTPTYPDVDFDLGVEDPGAAPGAPGAAGNDPAAGPAPGQAPPPPP